MEYLEIIATITSIIAVYLQAREKILAWPIAILSVTILAFIFFKSRLYSDFGLHLIYVLLNIYGWLVWYGRKGNEEKIQTLVLSKKGIYVSIIVTVIGAVILGLLMHKYTDADLPFFDAFTTSGSLVAQYLLAKKYLQNWLLWIIVDIVAIPVYLYKELFYISFLFMVFLVICSWGYYRWKKDLKSVKL